MMKKERSIRWAVAAILAVGLFAASAPQDRARVVPAMVTPVTVVPEKICPLTYSLAPGSLMSKKYAAKIESDNSKLSQLLAAYRGSVLGKTDLNADYWAKQMDDTYLRNPTLTTETGVRITGWREILPELLRVINESTYIDVQSVHVQFEYLPYGSEEYLRFNSTITKPESQIDFIGHVRTVLAYAPHDDPVTMEGDLPHRRTCDPIW
jgi:hypothetical protein